MQRSRSLAVLFVWASCLTEAHPIRAEVHQSAADGFQVSLVRVVAQPPATAYKTLTEQLPQWWDAEHSYSGKAESFSVDFDKACLLERLPDGGFVRHLEVVYHQPGKMLRLSGGLGPLQGMGIHGAMTFQFAPREDGHTEVRMVYIVTGYAGLQLDRIAPAVDRTLAGQLDRFQQFADHGRVETEPAP